MLENSFEGKNEAEDLGVGGTKLGGSTLNKEGSQEKVDPCGSFEFKSFRFGPEH